MMSDDDEPTPINEPPLRSRQIPGSAYYPKRGESRRIIKKSDYERGSDQDRAGNRGR